MCVWYDFDRKNRAEKEVAAFVGQCAYHYLDTIKKDVDGVSGWSCKTLGRILFIV